MTYKLNLLFNAFKTKQATKPFHYKLGQTSEAVSTAFEIFEKAPNGSAVVAQQEISSNPFDLRIYLE